MCYNPFSLQYQNQQKKLLPMHTANAFKTTISTIYHLGSKQENTLFECIMAAYEKMKIFSDSEKTWKRPAPTFETVYQQFENSKAFHDNDKLMAVMKKIRDFVIFEPDPYKVVPLKELLRGVLVVDVSDYDEDIQDLVVAITLDQFYAQMQSSGSSQTDGKLRQLRSFVLVDEADHIMNIGVQFAIVISVIKEEMGYNLLYE